MQTPFNHETLCYWDFKCHKDAAAVLGLYSLGNWVTFANKFASICVLYLLKHQSQGRFLNIHPMSLTLCLPESWVWNKRRGVHTGIFQQSLGRPDNDTRVQEFLLNAWCRNGNNYSVYECFQTVLWVQKVLSTRITNPSFSSTTVSLTSLNVRPFSALLKILSLCTKPAYMKGWRALKRKASELPALIDYSKKAFCRELWSFLNGLAVARLSPLCGSLVDGQTGIAGLLRSPQAHFNLDLWTQQMAAFNSAFEVCLLEDYKKLCSSCWRTRASVCLGNNQSCWHLFGWVISTKKPGK